MNFKVLNSFAVNPTERPPRITSAFGKFTVTSSKQKTFAKPACAERRAVRTREQFSWAEWLGDVIAGTYLEKHDFVCNTYVCAQHNTRQARSNSCDLPAIMELADIAPDPDITSKVRQIAARVPGVLGLDKCLVRKMGFSFYIDLHIIINGELSVREGHRVSHLVQDSVLQELPQVLEVLVHVEPEEELAAKGIARVK